MALKFKIKKGDRVVVITGRDKGKKGEVVQMMPQENRAIVRGVNLVQRHPRQSATSEGGIISKEAPIHISNIALVGSGDGWAYARWIQDAYRWPQGALRQEVGRSDRCLRRVKNTSRASSQRYDGVIREQLIKEFSYKNPMQVPRLDKVVLNMGVGEATADSKKLTQAREGPRADRWPEGNHDQGAQIDRRLQIARRHEYRLQGHVARSARMYEFVDRLITIALPRVRDFRGLEPKSFDGRGNFAMGVKEHIVFP